MESPEKRNANSNEAPPCCQGGSSNYFRGVPRAGAGTPGGTEPPRAARTAACRALLSAIHTTSRLGNDLQPGGSDFLAAIVTNTISPGRNPLERGLDTAD